MRLEDISFWSDNIYFEDNCGWYVTARGNVLTCLDADTNQIIFSKLLPNSKIDRLRLNSRCIKWNDFIFCAPCYEKDFWIYDLKNERFQKLELKYERNVHPVIWDMYKTDHELFALSKGWGEVIVIDPSEMKVKKKYSLLKTGEKLTNSIAVGEDIYCLISSSAARVCRFNMNSKRIEEYELPQIDEMVNGFCYDGTKFWISGCGKYLYIWEPSENRVETLDCYPKQLGRYDFSGAQEELLEYDLSRSADFLFQDIVNFEKHIWCIPFRTNNVIIIDKAAKKAEPYELLEEEETRESLKARELSHKYLIEYRKDERYLGLYSLKQRALVEIDTASRTARRRTYELDENTLRQLCLVSVDERQDSLPILIKAVEGCDNHSQSAPNEIAGEIIYRYLKEGK